MHRRADRPGRPALPARAPEGVQLLRGDPTDDNVIHRSQPARASRALIACTEDADTLVIAVALHGLAPQLEVYALTQAPRVAKALAELGVAHTLSSDELVGHTLAKSLETPEAGDLPAAARRNLDLPVERARGHPGARLAATQRGSRGLGNAGARDRPRRPPRRPRGRRRSGAGGGRSPARAAPRGHEVSKPLFSTRARGIPLAAGTGERFALTMRATMPRSQIMPPLHRRGNAATKPLNVDEANGIPGTAVRLAARNRSRAG